MQLCGDAHLSNFGVFGSPERRLLFDINDFDETFPGPWEWDVKRLAASFEVWGRERGSARPTGATSWAVSASIAVGCEGRAGCERSRRGTTTSRSKGDGSSSSAGGRGGSARRRRSRRRRTLRRREPATTCACFAKRAGEVDGELRIVADPPLIVPLEELAARDSTGGDRRYIRSLSVVPAVTGRHHHPVEEFE